MENKEVCFFSLYIAFFAASRLNTSIEMFTFVRIQKE